MMFSDGTRSAVMVIGEKKVHMLRFLIYGLQYLLRICIQEKNNHSSQELGIYNTSLNNASLLQLPFIHG